MARLDERTVANMDMALEQACRIFQHGGDHDLRKYVAEKLKKSARKGNTTFDGLMTVATSAVEELSRAEKKLG